MKSKALEEIELFRKEKLKSLYEQCTEPQQNFFNRMYDSLERIPSSKIDWAIQQCERTIAKNNEKKDIKKCLGDDLLEGKFTESLDQILE